jgi:hypothetical protein
MPTKYTPDFAERYYRLSCEGRSKKQIAADMLVYADTFDEWARDADKPEFAEAFKLGRQAQEAFFDKMAFDNMDNPKFKEGLFKYVTGMRFGWSEKSEQTIKNTLSPTSEVELDQRIKEKLKALGLNDTDVKPEQSRTPLSS